MKGPDPLEGFDLDPETVSADNVTVLLTPDQAPDDERAARFLVYLGLFDILAEAVHEACDDDEERATRYAALLGQVESVEPVLRFRLFERRRRAESQELISRMRGREIAVTRNWLIPRLEELITACRARIEALRLALEEAGR
jgi:hypothetical protein